MTTKAKPMEVPLEVAEDEMMARRAAWIALGRVPSDKADRVKDVNALVHEALLHCPDTNSKGYKLAHFAFQRWEDAQRRGLGDLRRTVADPPKVTEAYADVAAEKRASLEAELAVRELHNQALEPLRAATCMMQEALAILSKAHGIAATRQAEIVAKLDRSSPAMKFVRIEPLDGLVNGVRNATEQIQGVIDRITGKEDGGIGEDRKRLREPRILGLMLDLARGQVKTKVKLEHIAFVLGKPADSCGYRRPGYEAVRLRLLRFRNSGK